MVSVQGWDVAHLGREWISWNILSFLKVLLHPNSGAAGKVGEIEALRLAQYKAFYTTGSVSLPEAVKSGKEPLEFLDPCRYR